MALFQCNFFAETLGLSTTMHVIIPEKRRNSPHPVRDSEHPTLFLLHGASDDYSIWVRRTSIQRYAEERGLAVVMPQADLSFYADMVSGNNYWSFISQELPQKARWFFSLSARRADTFAAGLSMGGYGAFKLGLRCPQSFAAAASLSGALDMAAAKDRSQEQGRSDLFRNIFGPESIAGTDHDLLHLVDQLHGKPGPKPSLFQCCGTEDFLYQDNLRFRRRAEASSLDLTYDEGPGGHDWSYWDQKIQDVIRWLPLPKV